MSNIDHQSQILKKVSLSKQLLLFILLVSTVFTLLSTVFGLYLDYKSELKEIDGHFRQIQDSYQASLASTLWMEDRVLLLKQAEGIFTLPEITYLKIANKNEVIIELGNIQSEKMLEKSWQLNYISTKKTFHLATITVQSSLLVVYQNLFDKLLLLLVGNTIQIFMISVFILFITYRILVKPLTEIATSVSLFDDNSVPLPISLSKRWFQDEITTLVYRYNESVEYISDNYQQLEEARRCAEEANLKKNEFLANMSHEIRTPMNGIIGLSGLMRDMKMSADQKEYINMLHTSSLSLLDLINDILDFSKIEAGKIELEIMPLNLFALNKEIESLFTVRAAERRLSLQCTVDSRIAPLLLGDVTKLRQILSNLISNAIKFTEKGYVHLHIQLVSDMKDSSRIQFEVSDSGIGVSVDKHEMIFEKFQQADGSTTRKYGGTGLGLSICQEMVRLMGGELSIISTLGKGSRFIFMIDLAKNKQLHTREDIEALSGLNVLLVDDSMLNMRITSAQLKALGVKANICDDSQKAVAMVSTAIAEGDAYDVVILDKIMPKIDGFELAHLLNSEFGVNCPKMMMISAAPDCAGDNDVKYTGVRFILTRPYNETHLKWALQSLLSESSLPNKSFQHSSIEDQTQEALSQSQETVSVSTNALFESQSSSHTLLLSPEHDDDCIISDTAVISTPELVVSGHLLRVLVVEDTVINQKVAKMILEKLGATVVIVDNGQLAVQAYREQTFDMIFMDCQMPVLDGFEATKAIRQIEPLGKRIPIIALTANVLKEEKIKCLDAGMDDFISKPVSQQTLKKMLSQYASQ